MIIHIKSRLGSFYIILYITFSSIVDLHMCTYQYTRSNYATRQNDAIDSMFFCIEVFHIKVISIKQNRLKKCKFTFAFSFFFYIYIFRVQDKRQVTMRQVD
jgi:hypothetical protein